MNIKLPETIISLQDLKALIMEIRGYGKWYSQYSVKAKVTHAEEPTVPAPAVSQAASDIIHAWLADQPTQKSLDAIIATLQDMSTDAPRITLTLAAPPPGGLQKDLVEWCRKNIDPTILVSFKFNATILGGLVVQHGSHIYDWSFRRQVLDARSKFPEVLRHV